MLKIFMLVVLGFQTHSGTAQEPQARVDEELNLALILERIANTSPEGIEVIEKIKSMVPVIQKHRSGKTLGEAVDDCIRGQGSIIYPIGWEAFKSDGPRWKVIFYFQDAEQKYAKAVWEYNEEVRALIPAEFTNATRFWVRRSRNLNP